MCGVSKLAAAPRGKMTIHDTKDLRVTLDDDAVSLYLFDTHVVTMTLAEWKQINTALEGLGNE